MPCIALQKHSAGNQPSSRSQYLRAANFRSVSLKLTEAQCSAHHAPICTVGCLETKTKQAPQQAVPPLPQRSNMIQQTIKIARVSTGTVYKLLFIGTAFSFLPLTTLFGILAFFGLNTVTWNRVPVHGFEGLVTGFMLGIFFCVFSTLFLGTACAFGLWLHSKFAMIRISYVLQDADETASASSRSQLEAS